MIKVFYWDVVELPAQGSIGYAIGFGDTKADVIETILSDTTSRDELRDELLSKEPKILDAFPVGWARFCFWTDLPEDDTADGIQTSGKELRRKRAEEPTASYGQVCRRANELEKIVDKLFDRITDLEWFIRRRDSRYVGTYTGDGSEKRWIDTPDFEPDSVVVESDEPKVYSKSEDGFVVSEENDDG